MVRFFHVENRVRTPSFSLVSDTPPELLGKSPVASDLLAGLSCAVVHLRSPYRCFPRYLSLAFRSSDTAISVPSPPSDHWDFASFARSSGPNQKVFKKAALKGEGNTYPRMMIEFGSSPVGYFFLSGSLHVAKSPTLHQLLPVRTPATQNPSS